MKRIAGLLFCLSLLMITSCENDKSDDHIACTLEARAGLNISVSLGTMGSITGEGVTVVATDGDYSETLTFYDAADPVFTGAFERTGNYIITVSKEGFQTFTSEPIKVMADRCHVVSRIVHVVLEPLE